MDIHQINLRYDAVADRILWQVRAHSGEVVAAWITRRMARQVWEPYKTLLAQISLPQARPQRPARPAQPDTANPARPDTATPAQPDTATSAADAGAPSSLAHLASGTAADTAGIPPASAVADASRLRDAGDTPAPAAARRTAPAAVLLPEAREMLVQAARERSLPHASFDQPFVAAGNTLPLGTEPLLPNAVDLAPQADDPSAMSVRLREASGRSMSLTLNTELASGLLRLLEQALREADWGLPLAPAAGRGADGGPAAPPTPRLLN